MNGTLLLALALPAAVAVVDCAPPQPPDWLPKNSLAQLPKIGIDPVRDLAVQGNYHWRWIAHRPLVVDHYRCPPGSFVDISRNIIVVGPTNENDACHDEHGAAVEFLKLYPDDGSAEPLGS